MVSRHWLCILGIEIVNRWINDSINRLETPKSVATISDLFKREFVIANLCGG